MKQLSSRALKKKEHIQLTAQKLFLEQGFSNTSMDTITKEAAVSKQTIYSYFDSKEDLLNDVFKYFIENTDVEDTFKLTQKLDMRNLDDLITELEAFSVKVIDTLFQPAYLGMVRVVLAEIYHYPQLGLLFKEAIPAKIIGRLSDILSYADEEGIITIDKTNIGVIARMLIGPLLTYILLDGLLVPKNQVNLPSYEKIETIVHAFVKSIH